MHGRKRFICFEGGAMRRRRRSDVRLVRCLPPASCMNIEGLAELLFRVRYGPNGEPHIDWRGSGWRSRRGCRLFKVIRRMTNGIASC